MIDLHTHILPGIDDGAKNVEESFAMIDALVSMDVEEIVLSSHFYPMQQSLEEFVSERYSACETLVKAVAESGKKTPKFHIASEVYYDSILFNYNDLKELTLDGKGEYMLLELPYANSLSNETVKGIERLCYNRSITPILAHIDRYPYMMREENLLRLLDIGCLAQVNIISFGNFIKRIRLNSFIKRGYISAFGSDIHSPNELDMLKNAKKSISAEYLEAVSNETRLIFQE